MKIPHTAFVMFNNGALGGAQKRFTNLFLHLNKLHPETFFLIINIHVKNQLERIFSNLPEKQIRVIEIPGDKNSLVNAADAGSPLYFKDTVPDPIEVDKEVSWLRKIYWYNKNRIRQKNIFKNIELVREKLKIETFIGVYSGVLPLVFYFDKPNHPKIIFSNMDSWFTEVHADMKKLWYRKYYSFNYAMENADAVDFLSPYVYEGVKKRNVNIDMNKSYVAPNSFVDYSKCFTGDKSGFEVAFCSRLEPDKNPMLFLEAAKNVVEKIKDIKFYILGEGSLVNDVENFISANKLQNKIDFTFHNNPPEIFSRTTVFVSLQSGTNYPSQSVLEAMACGNAIIASNVGDTTLFINESNGLLINLNKDELVKAIIKLYSDRKLTSSLGNNARGFVLREHTVEKMSSYYLNLIQAVTLS